MAILGLEISDVGILAAGDNPVRLLEVDGQRQESPGFAIPEEKRLLVGNSAAGKAHLFPLQVMNRFWDQLNTEPLERKTGLAQNHAEIACAHLSRVWENIKDYGAGIIVAVPGYYGREQLGLILGMAQELSIPVKGFVSLPVAASRTPRPDAMLFHLDIHLHRFEIAYLHQDSHLRGESSVTVEEVNLEQFSRGWVESIAEEFVRSTRFDPLHEAATEQDIYNRLPAALEMLKSHTSFIFEIAQGTHSYRITLLRELLKQKSESMYDMVCRSIVKMRNDYGNKADLIVLQLTHRMASLPGIKDKLSEIDNCEVIELEPGAGAQGVLQFWGHLADYPAGGRASFFTSRPWQEKEPQPPGTTTYKTSGKAGPTHVLYRDVAFRLSDKPLTIGCDDPGEGRGIRVQASSPEVSGKHCTVQRDSGRIVLRDFSAQGTFVDDQRISGSMTLEPGQTVRLGTSGETIRLITCVESDET
jgi:hypothetical protein